MSRVLGAWMHQLRFVWEKTTKMCIADVHVNVGGSDGRNYFWDQVGLIIRFQNYQVQIMWHQERANMSINVQWAKVAESWLRKPTMKVQGTVQRRKQKNKQKIHNRNKFCERGLLSCLHLSLMHSLFCFAWSGDVFFNTRPQLVLQIWSQYQRTNIDIISYQSDRHL